MGDCTDDGVEAGDGEGEGEGDGMGAAGAAERGGMGSRPASMRSRISFACFSYASSFASSE